MGAPTRLVDYRNVEIAFLVGLHLRFADRLQSGGPQEAGDGALGRANAWAFLFFLDVGLTCGNATHRQRKPAWRGKCLSAFVGEACLDQPVRHQLAQILSRARLHTRRDFLRQEFEQKIGHVGRNMKKSRRVRSA